MGSDYWTHCGRTGEVYYAGQGSRRHSRNHVDRRRGVTAGDLYWKPRWSLSGGTVCRLYHVGNRGHCAVGNLQVYPEQDGVLSALAGVVAKGTSISQRRTGRGTTFIGMSRTAKVS